MERHFCLDCNVIAPLDSHGNCSTCGSVAVVSEHRQQIRRVVRDFNSVTKSWFTEAYAALGGFPMNNEEMAACLFLESKGKRFCVDFGYENALVKASEFREWKTPSRA